MKLHTRCSTMGSERNRPSTNDNLIRSFSASRGENTAACPTVRRIMSSSTCAQSPMIGMSTLTFLLIDDGSMST